MNAMQFASRLKQRELQGCMNSAAMQRGRSGNLNMACTLSLSPEARAARMPKSSKFPAAQAPTSVKAAKVSNQSVMQRHKKLTEYIIDGERRSSSYSNRKPASTPSVPYATPRAESAAKVVKRKKVKKPSVASPHFPRNSHSTIRPSPQAANKLDLSSRLLSAPLGNAYSDFKHGEQPSKSPKFSSSGKRPKKSLLIRRVIQKTPQQDI